VRLVLDPAATAHDDARPLFPADGEFRRTIAALAATALARVPDAVVLELYAAEFAERARESAASAASALHAPFWPVLLFEAAGLEVHPAHEIERLLPPFDAIVLHLRDAGSLAAAALAVLGAPRFDLPGYLERAREFAARRRWEVVA